MKTNKIFVRISLAVLFILAQAVNTIDAQAQPAVTGGGEANPQLKTNQQSLEQWKAMRFGMFIHWGPVTLRGTEIGWSRGENVSVNDYDNLYREFNPVLFNAADWVKAAKEAGMKYIVIVSKHHDGFTMWDSKLTDYKITATPFGRDVLKEISDECRKQGILFCTYYSIADWHNLLYATRHGSDARPLDSANMPVYINYMKAQLSELILKYGTNLLWFDGEWEGAWTHDAGMDLYKYCRSLNDKLLINNRVDKGRDGMKGKTVSNKFAGDFGTPEQEVGNYDISGAWESCITICTQWSWKPNDSIKSLKECIQMLVKSCAGGGNLLLNVSPMLDGRMEQRQVNRLKEIGDWLVDNGESIYGTQGGPYKPTQNLFSTRKGNKIYLHVFPPVEDIISIPLPGDHNIVSIKTISGHILECKKEKKSFLVKIKEIKNQIDAIVVIELEDSAMNIGDITLPVQKAP